MENEIYKELDASLNELSESIARYLSFEGISEISSKDLDIIIRKSAYSLPTRPSEAGMTPQQIKAAFFRPFTDTEKSLAAEINRVAREINRKDGTLAELVPKIKDILVGIIEKNKEFKEALEKELESYLKRIDGEAGIEYAYAQRDGEGRLKPMSLSPTAGSIALRGEGGRLKAGTPRDDDDVVTKGYADKTHYGASQIFASALKGSESGEAVALKDVSPLEHNLGVRVESKNLIPFPYSEQLSSSGGVNFVYNADGTITITGTPTEYVMIHLIGKAWPETPDAVGAYLEDGETYTLSMTGVNGEELLPVCMIIGKNKSDGTAMYIDANKPFTVDKSVYRYDVIRVYINAPLFGQEFNCTIAIQLEKGKATPYAPYIADTSGVKLLVYGGDYENPIEYSQGEDIKSIYPTTTIMTDTEGAVVEVEYNRDLNQAFAELYQAIISLGGNV